MPRFDTVLGKLVTNDPSKADIDPSTGKLKTTQLPDIAYNDYLGVVANEATMLLLGAVKGDFVTRSDQNNTTWIVSGNDSSIIGGWTQLPIVSDPSKLSTANNLSDLANATTARTNLGLGNVDNTSDLNKPISTATQTALNNKSDIGHTHAYPVTSVNSQTGVVVLSKSDVGLGNVDNTSDLNKPISTATQTALNNKTDIGHTHTKSEVGLSNVDNTSDLNKPISTATQTALNNKSDIGHTHTSSNITDLNITQVIAGTTYSITDSDITGTVTFTSGSPITVTCNFANTRTGWVRIIQAGAGQITLNGTVYPAGIGLTGKTRSQYSVVELGYYQASTSPILAGDMA